jgi:acyl-CoA thioesterase-1
MSRPRIALGALLLAAALAAPLAPPAAADPPRDSCAAPADLTRLHGRLPRTAMRIARHEALTVVAIGSSSTEGVGASTPAAAYPSRVEAELARRLPRQSVTVLNKGVGGETAVDMLARFDRDVFAAHPDLVIWQVGTNSVLHDTAIAGSREAVEAGIERLKQAGIDLVIMDLQYAPAVLAHPLHRDMVHGIAKLAKEDGVPLFRRFALMRHWVQSAQLDFTSMLAPDGLHLNDLSYGCIGRMLGDAIVDTALPSTMTSHR